MPFVTSASVPAPVPYLYVVVPLTAMVQTEPSRVVILNPLDAHVADCAAHARDDDRDRLDRVRAVVVARLAEPDLVPDGEVGQRDGLAALCELDRIRHRDRSCPAIIRLERHVRAADRADGDLAEAHAAETPMVELDHRIESGSSGEEGYGPKVGGGAARRAARRPRGRWGRAMRRGTSRPTPTAKAIAAPATTADPQAAPGRGVRFENATVVAGAVGAMGVRSGSGRVGVIVRFSDAGALVGGVDLVQRGGAS